MKTKLPLIKHKIATSDKYIIVTVETWLDKDVNDNEVSPSGQERIIYIVLIEIAP